MEDSTFIESWLEQIEGDVPLAAIEQVHETRNAKKGIENHDAQPPTTPLRIYGRDGKIDAFSPVTTDTISTGIFVRPEDDGRGLRKAPQIDDGTLSEVTTFSSNEHDKDDWTFKQLEGSEPSQSPTLAHSAARLSSYEPPSTISSKAALFQLQAQSPILYPNEQADPNPDKPQNVFITSCFQCVLAGLPCSRTYPACSRCRRNGSEQLCLLHRRKRSTEMVLGDIIANRTPVLLHVRGEDCQAWDKKLGLLQEVKSSPRAP